MRAAVAQSVERRLGKAEVGGSIPLGSFCKTLDDWFKGFLCMGFSLLRALEFFVFRKMEMPETKTHLLCGWSQIVIQKNHLSVTIELFRHYCKKGKVILWQKRITI